MVDESMFLHFVVIVIEVQCTKELEETTFSSFVFKPAAVLLSTSALSVSGTLREVGCFQQLHGEVATVLNLLWISASRLLMSLHVIPY